MEHLMDEIEVVSALGKGTIVSMKKQFHNKVPVN